MDIANVFIKFLLLFLISILLSFSVGFLFFHLLTLLLIISQSIGLFWTTKSYKYFFLLFQVLIIVGLFFLEKVNLNNLFVGVTISLLFQLLMLKLIIEDLKTIKLFLFMTFTFIIEWGLYFILFKLFMPSNDILVILFAFLLTVPFALFNTWLAFKGRVPNSAYRLGI